MAERESRARSETAGDGTASGGGKGRLGDNPSRQLDPLHRGPGYESRRVLLFRPDLRIFAPTYPSPGYCSNRNSSSQQQSVRCVPQQASRRAGNFSFYCMFRGETGEGHTRQPVGPSVDTAIMATVLSTNRVDSRSFSSRSCAFRRTNTSTDPIRLLCIRLALPLTLSSPSRFVPGTKLMVSVSPWAPWFAGVFSRDCTFWDCREGVLAINRQSVGPLVSTSAITTATCIITWTRGGLAHDVVRSGVHTRAQTLFGYFASY